MKDGIIRKRGNHERQRLFPGARGRAPQNRALRQEEARERLVHWRSLSLKERLQELDRRLGDEQGARRQRARLLKLLETPVAPSPKKSTRAR